MVRRRRIAVTRDYREEVVLLRRTWGIAMAGCAVLLAAQAFPARSAEFSIRNCTSGSIGVLAFNSDDGARLVAYSGAMSIASRDSVALQCATAGCTLRIEIRTPMLAWTEPSPVSSDKCLYHFRSGHTGYHELVAMDSLWCQPSWCGQD